MRAKRGHILLQFCLLNCPIDTKHCFIANKKGIIKKLMLALLCGTVLGSAIVVESIVVFSLGVLLLYFMCKCALVLIHEKRRQKAPDIELSKVQSSSKRTVSWLRYFLIGHFYSLNCSYTGKNLCDMVLI